jgi:hypothetical protein
MPKPHKGEKKKDFISRCIPILIDEGKEQKQAAAICYSMWERKDEATEEIINKVLNEAEEYTVMFFDPDLAPAEKKRKNTLVVGKVVNDKLQIVDGEVWVGGKFEDDVIPGVAELVKKWKPQTVFVEDNIFQRLLKKIMSEYNIPFKGITRQSSKEAVGIAADSATIEWKIQRNKDLLFGVGSLLMLLKKMKKIAESTVVADVIDKDTPIKDMERRRSRKKCKKAKKFKEELLKEDA